MAELFENHIKTLQVCESCQNTWDQRHILKYEQMHCSSYCEVCYQSKAVSKQCKLFGQVSHLPSLQFCDSCNDKDVPCFRRVVMIVCSDCETGNKTAFKTLKAKLEVDAVDPNLAFLPVLPDCPYVGKSIKSAFSNWWLKC